MAKQTHVSIKQLETLLNTQTTLISIPQIEHPENTVDIEVCNTLSFDAALEFVASITNVVCGVNENTQEPTNYHPEYFDFMVRYATVYYYSNCNLPQKVAKQYHILYHTEVFNNVVNAINYEQWEQLVKAAKQQVEYYKTLLHNPAREIVNAIGSLVEAGGLDLSKMSVADFQNVKKVLDNIGSLQEISNEDWMTAVMSAQNNAT